MENKIKNKSDIKITFIGHRFVNNEKFIYDKLIAVVENWIKEGAISFTMGTHGMFDQMALSVCRNLRGKYRDIKICAVLTSLAKLKKNQDGYSEADIYSDVMTMFYPIEDEFYKNQITVSNRFMIDESDVVICYVDMKRRNSGAKRALLYAQKKGKVIINLFEKH